MVSKMPSHQTRNREHKRNRSTNTKLSLFSQQAKYVFNKYNKRERELAKKKNQRNPTIEIANHCVLYVRVRL